MFVETQSVICDYNIKSYRYNQTNLGHYFSLALLAEWLSHSTCSIYFIVIVSKDKISECCLLDKNFVHSNLAAILAQLS